MSNQFLRLRRIAFVGPKKTAEVKFANGVNVICGASDTGKSFLAESIDFMLGGSILREIPQRTPYGEIEIDIDITDGEQWRFNRSTSGGNFKARNLLKDEDEILVLKQDHGHGKTDNMSGFLLDKIGLLGRRILRSKQNCSTQSLSFRNLARLAIVQEGEIQQTGSPFWGGQYTLKTAELATIKLLLTGIDDSAVVGSSKLGPDAAKEIAFLDEVLLETKQELPELGETEIELKAQFSRLESTIEERRKTLNIAQGQLDALLARRRDLVNEQTEVQDRLDEIADMLSRFNLLLAHYAIDIERLTAILECGGLFVHAELVACPLCGTPPESQKHESDCEGNIAEVIASASAEIQKIERLKTELGVTIATLAAERTSLASDLNVIKEAYNKVSVEIKENVTPSVGEERASFSELVEKRAVVNKGIELYARLARFEERKRILEEGEVDGGSAGVIVSGPSSSVAHEFSIRVSKMLKDWDFPGDCMVHYDKELTDLVIDGKPRGSFGKGLRAITHAAVTIALLEYCLENDLPHPGFVVVDSPLLAYFKPEGDDVERLQGAKLKENFYSYLIEHHSVDSQIVIIENQHPPVSIVDALEMTVFTGNPSEGRSGFL
jgi:hypothetical protein